MDNDKLARMVVGFLRDYKVLEGKPVFSRTKRDFVCVDPRGYWDEYYMVPPFWQHIEVDVLDGEFESIDSVLPRMDFDTVQKNALGTIPDSDNSVIIELGSEYGHKGAGYLGLHKPNANVILVSKSWNEHAEPRYLFMQHRGLNHALVFHEGMELLKEENLEKRVNGLYKANGIGNVAFHIHEMVEEDTSPKGLPSFLRGLECKDVYLFSHFSPVKLPFIIGGLFRTLNARYMCVSMTAIEKILPGEFPWVIVQKQLGLTDVELRGYIASTHDPVAVKVQDSFSYKYDYKNPTQEKIAVIIKLGIALALAKEVNGSVFRDNNPEHRYNYNKIDHYVIARRD